jgi:hypothetical protein
MPAGAAVLLAVAGWYAVQATATATAPPDVRGAAPARGSAARAEAEVPRIDLARLDRARPATVAGQRDIFDFGARLPPGGGRTAPPTEVAPPPPVDVAPPPPVTVATPPPLPPLNIKYIGVLENKRGLKVAVLMTDRKEVLTGQVGEVVANRLKIVRIGIESVDVQEVGSEQVRRIPLKGN